MLSACSVREEDSKKKVSEPIETPSRIKIIDYGTNSWRYFEIIEVDGHEYLCNTSHGGIIHLESCPCKSKY